MVWNGKKSLKKNRFRVYNLLDRFRKKKKEEDTMSDLYDTVKTQIDTLIVKYKEALSDNVLTFVEAWTLAQLAFTAFVAIAETIEGATGEQKKEVVMKAAERLFDEVLGPYDIKKIPNVFEPAFDRFSKAVYLELVSVAVDFVVKFQK